MAAILSNGVAEVDNAVLDQLKAKHPSRPADVIFPSQEEIMDEETDRGGNSSHDIEMEECKDDVRSSSVVHDDGAETSRKIFPSLVINAEQILCAAKKAKRMTSGGLQQISPWLLKRAFLEDTTLECATIAGQLATRWGRGDFETVLGELVAESQLIALYKDDKRKDVRPISVCALRRLLTRSYCAQIRGLINSHVQATQIGVMKGGYEIGIHAMRELVAQAKRLGEVVMLLDFANAFNTVDRNLMLRLTAEYCPELTNLVFWLYEREPHLITTGGDIVKSSTGTQQGCTLSNPLFALTMEYIAKKIVIKGLRVKMFYWDDTALVATPEAVAKAVETIRVLAEETGLQLRWKKCHIYGTPELVSKCKTVSPSLPSAINLHETYDMVYLKAPIGSDVFVEEWLDGKVRKLEAIVTAIAKAPYKHEAFTLLRSCAAECRVTYLMRVIPTRQLEKFMKDFDNVLQKGSEVIMGIPIKKKWWRLAQLPPKYGGMALRSGLQTYGAQHLCSLAKSANNVDRIVGGWNVIAIAKRDA